MGIRMFLNLGDVQAKVEWEGGLFETAYGYGLSHNVIDPDALPELHAAWKAMDEAYEQHFRAAYDQVELLLHGGQ